MNSSILNILLFNLSFISILIFTRRVVLTLRDLDLPLIPAGAVIVGSVIYFSSLIPGILGILTPSSVTFTVITLCIASVYLLKFLSRKQLPVAGSKKAVLNIDAGHEFGLIKSIVAGFFSLVGFILVARYIYRIVSGLFDPQKQLTVDVIVYHLPNFIQYYQERTLWIMKGTFETFSFGSGTFRSFSFGYDLISNFPGIFFQAHWGLYLSDLFSVILFLGCIYSLTELIIRIWYPLGSHSVWKYLPVIWTSWFYLFRPDKLHVGKNDIFLNACILASLVLLLEIIFGESENRSVSKYYTILLISSMSSGLALATKPNALGYVLFLPLVLFIALLFRPYQVPRKAGHPIIHSLVLLLVPLLTGGYFLARNLLEFGRLVDPAISKSAFSMTIIANLSDPRFYILHKHLILLPTAIAILSALIYRCWCTRKFHDKFTFLFILSGFYLSAFISALITPWGIRSLGSAGASLALRQIMMLVTCMLVALFVLFIREDENVQPSDQITKWSLGKITSEVSSSAYSFRRVLKIPSGILDSLITLVLVAFFILVGAVSFHWARNPMAGLPGYENFVNIPETKIYSFVQNLNEPVRIYSAGLFPYGLYGVKWNNKIQFELGTDSLIPETSGQARIRRIVKEFKPNYILISTAHGWPPEPVREVKKPLYALMNAQKKCFEEVYSDSGASAFRVRDDCIDILSGD